MAKKLAFRILCTLVCYRFTFFNQRHKIKNCHWLFYDMFERLDDHCSRITCIFEQTQNNTKRNSSFAESPYASIALPPYFSTFHCLGRSVLHCIHRSGASLRCLLSTHCTVLLFFLFLPSILSSRFLLSCCCPFYKCVRTFEQSHFPLYDCLYDALSGSG